MRKYKRTLTKLSEDLFKVNYDGTSWFDLCNGQEALKINEENEGLLNDITRSR